MTQQPTITKDRTAVVIMDYQNDIVNNVAPDPQAVVRQAAQVLAGARKAGIPVIYIQRRGVVHTQRNSSSPQPL